MGGGHRSHTSLPNGGRERPRPESRKVDKDEVARAVIRRPAGSRPCRCKYYTGVYLRGACMYVSIALKLSIIAATPQVCERLEERRYPTGYAAVYTGVVTKLAASTKWEAVALTLYRLVRDCVHERGDWEGESRETE